MPCCREMALVLCYLGAIVPSNQKTLVRRIIQLTRVNVQQLPRACEVKRQRMRSLYPSVAGGNRTEQFKRFGCAFVASVPETENEST